MAHTKLTELADAGALDEFESLVLSSLESGAIDATQLVEPLQRLETHCPSDKVATIGQFVIDNVDLAQDPRAALVFARVTLLADPENAAARERLVEAYRRVHGDRPGFAELLEASGLTGGRAARAAVRMLEACLQVRPGDVLLSRTEGGVAEVLDLSLEEGLITLRRDGRPRTLPLTEFAREYDRADPDDFRVLRELRPERLRELLEKEPARMVKGLLRLHGEVIDQEALKAELVPRLLEPARWSKWWTRTRNQLKRDPHVTLEGRSPVLLRYNALARSIEDETWEAFTAESDPHKWLAVIEGYLREKRGLKEEPDGDFLRRCHEHLVETIGQIESRRPAEAFACALVTERIDQESGIPDDDAHQLAISTLKKADRPAQLLRALPDHAALWSLALAALSSARDDAARVAAELFPSASAVNLDELVEIARGGGELARIQEQVDRALNEPVAYPEVMYWLWKGPGDASGLSLPEDPDLFEALIQTLSGLGVTIHAPADQMKTFRGRMRTALGLRSFEKAKACVAQVDANRAVTLRTQLQRLDGVGDTTRDKLLSALREAHPALWHVAPRRVQPWEDVETLWTTQSGLKRKTEERDYLQNVTMRENAQRIGEAASHGDLSENSEYKFALEERDLLRARLGQMNRELSLARVLDTHDVPEDHVGVGSKVTLRSATDGSERTVVFLGPFDADPDHGVYNYKAPFSQQLMGHRPGERVKTTMGNEEQEFEIVRIANGLQ